MRKSILAQVFAQLPELVIRYNLPSEIDPYVFDDTDDKTITVTYGNNVLAFDYSGEFECYYVNTFRGGEVRRTVFD